MANQCEICKRHLGFFNTKNICDVEGCNATVCNDCLAKANESTGSNSWGTCSSCDKTYCGKHYDSHPCDSDDEESEEITDDDSSDSSDEASDSDLSICDSKDKNLVVISQNDLEFYVLVESVGDYLSKGYVISAITEDDDGNSSVWMVKK